MFLHLKQNLYSYYVRTEFVFILCENFLPSAKIFFVFVNGEYQKQLEEQYEQELEAVRKFSESDVSLQDFSFSRKATDMSDQCKAIAENKIRLATQTYERVSECIGCTLLFYGLGHHG